jgi:hypothetical protein
MLPANLQLMRMPRIFARLKAVLSKSRRSIPRFLPGWQTCQTQQKIRWGLIVPRRGESLQTPRRINPPSPMSGIRIKLRSRRLLSGQCDRLKMLTQAVVRPSCIPDPMK